jgi:predicted MPP superfamily phosphohydrolase
MEKLKICSIGDVHGRDSWKFITHGSPYEFEQWAIMVNEGADPSHEFFKDDYPYFEFDKIVFIGDYVDSFTLTNVVIKKNLEDIILFKKSLGDKVVLIWGNHDVHYYIPGQTCSGYRPEAKYDLEDIYRTNKDLFQLAFQIKDHLWTHAGLTKPILKALKKYEYTKELKTEAEILNECFLREAPEIFHVDRESGGWNLYAGPLWVRPARLLEDSVNLHQIVGHTPQSGLYNIKTKRGFNIWVIDYLEYGDDNNIVPFILEV